MGASRWVVLDGLACRVVRLAGVAGEGRLVSVSMVHLVIHTAPLSDDGDGDSAQRRDMMD